MTELEQDQKTKETAIMFGYINEEHSFLLKWGDPEWIEPYYDEERNRHMEGGLPDMPRSVTLVKTMIPLKELDKIVNHLVMLVNGIRN